MQKISPVPRFDAMRRMDKIGIAALQRACDGVAA
jgi:hypothetical protein